LISGLHVRVRPLVPEHRIAASGDVCVLQGRFDGDRF
jgi:hypothetical protein